jgi:hypothetical protein
MSRVKQASKQKRTTKAAAVKVLGAAGLSFSMVGNTSASTVPTASIPQPDNISPNQRFVLSEEEMVDVSFPTFNVFDRENVGSGVQLAVVVRGCRAGGCRGCRVGGCRGCRVGGCGGGPCRGLRRLLRTLGIVPLVLSPTKSAVVTVGGSLLVYPNNQTNSVRPPSQKPTKAVFRRPVLAACAR